MKKLFFLAALAGVLFNSVQTNAQQVEDSALYINWQNQDPTVDKSWGISTDKAYNELLKGKTSKTVIVAVIDNGVDIDHVELKDHIWTNEDEIPDNGIDDDNNGYIDDIHGWNFLGNSKGENVVYATLEVTRLYEKFSKEYDDFSDSAIEANKNADIALLNKVRTTYMEKMLEALENKNSYDYFFTLYNRFDSITIQALGKEKYTLEELKVFEAPEQSAADTAIKFMKDMLRVGVTKSYLDEIVSYYSSKVNYHYNLEYNSRTIVGDDVTVWSDSAYGNNDLKGTSPDHGTMVSGIIAATRNNGIGINGIADNVKIMVLRTIPDGDEWDKDVAKAIKYAIDNGAQLINMSFGKSFSPQKKFVDDVVKLADQKNVLLIHAAGNDSEDMDKEENYPSNYSSDNEIIVKNWLTVGANSKNKNKKQFVADFSNYGQKNVDLFAPGHNIITCTPGNKYDMASGTSFSAPTVTGAAALVKEYYPELTAVQLKDILLQSTEKTKCKVIVPGTGGKTKKVVRFNSLSVTGGVVNVYNALVLAGQVAGQ